jgi:hypothetical protein
LGHPLLRVAGGAAGHGPDGYRGWIGPYEYGEPVWCDVHVGDGTLFDGLLGFSEIVFGDRALVARYGEPARKYIELAQRHLFEKWDARGAFIVGGCCGAYRCWNRYGASGNFEDWNVRDEIRNSNLALPFNKQDDVAAAALKLYRITATRAIAIAPSASSRFKKAASSLSTTTTRGTTGSLAAPPMWTL